MIYENGQFKGVGSLEEFDAFEKVLIKHCERKDREPVVPKLNLVVRPKLREVIVINGKKTS